MIIARVTIGPSDYDRHGVDYGTATADRDGYLQADDGAGYPLAECRHPDTTDGWARAARRHARRPNGLRWCDAEVRPLGWSEGPGHAPGGVELVWRKGGGR
jgi:hypothetical protein